MLPVGGLSMKTSLFLGALSTVFVASTASAADLPVKAPSKDDGVQQVLKPEPGRPGLAKGGESPARA